MKKKYGFVRPRITADNYVFGSITGLPKVVLQPDGQWDAFLPVYEPQYGGNWDTYGCTVWGTQNAIEMLVKRLAKREDNYSERYNYILADIVPPGSDPHWVAEVIRSKGVIDNAKLPMTDSLKDFNTPKPMKQEFLDLGAKWPFIFKHEWLWNNAPSKKVRTEKMKEALQYSPVGISVTAWYKDGNVYVDRGERNTHWCVCYGWNDQGWKVFDSYDQSTKILSYDHKIEVAKRYYIVDKTVDKQISIITKLLEALKQLVGLMEKEQNLQTAAGNKLFEVTKANVGKDLSPKQDAFGCAETVYTLLRLAFGDTYKTSSTKVSYEHMVKSPSYQLVQFPLAGDIVISPTGYGNGKVSNGHMGIVLENGFIASNNSYNSKLEVNYNTESWKQRYGVIGGFPVVFFRRLS